MTRYQSQTERTFEEFEALTSQLAAVAPGLYQNGQSLEEVFPDLVQRVRALRETLRVLDPENVLGY